MIIKIEKSQFLKNKNKKLDFFLKAGRESEWRIVKTNNGN